jgi:pimeloyl-ACP methyl ester carboxylesterase
MERLARLPADSKRETLFFLHGRLATGESWEPLIDQLPHFRCIFLDFPGSGESFVVDQRGPSFMEAVELCAQVFEHFLRPGERGILIGQDVGGLIALLCASRFKEKVAGVVLLNSVHLLDSGLAPGCSGWSGGRLWGWLGACLGSWKIRKQFQKLLALSSLKNPALPALLGKLWESRGHRESRIAAIRSISDSWPGPFERRFWAQEVRSLSCPVLLLWGAQDELNPLSKGLDLLKLLPHGDFYQDGCGHWPQLENPDWVAGKIREFLFRKENGRKHA